MHKNENHVREPLFHIVKRAALPGWQSAAIRVLAVLISLIVCGIIIIQMLVSIEIKFVFHITSNL